MILAPSISTVVLGLIAAAAFGASDFGGGLLARRSAVLGVVLISQSFSVAVAVALTVIAGEGVPERPDLAWSLLAGVFGATALSALYRGLAIGRMGLVAPVTAILASAIPVVGGVVLQGVPSIEVSVGIGIALVAVVVISWESTAIGASRVGLWLAVLSGSAFGLYEITVAQISADSVFGPLAVIRATQAALVAVVIATTRTPWRPERSQVLPIAAIGLLEMIASGTFLVAVQTGSLAVASVTSSLYPVVTILLAAVLLRERVGRRHAAGIGLAMLAIVLIGAGSA